jgi:UDP-N-acetylglucosamine--N-acetylmuramyl-(pentapeptide) pyrophosphoryl-undecaprenol N-acetylglucosamine transferase
MENYRNNSKTIVIAGGGTGGHLFPAIALGEELTFLGYTIIYIGSKFGIESKVLPTLKNRYYLFNIKGLQRTISFKNVINNTIFPYRFLITFIKSYILLKKLNPIVVIGTGGYASGLPLLASLKLKIRTLIHEQNSYPGITTRKLCNIVDTVCITSIDSKKYINGNIKLTGIPIRKNLVKMNKEDSRKKLNLNRNKKTIFILGGSQGSLCFNNHFYNEIDFYTNNNFQIIWQCGFNNFEEYNNKINNKNILLKDFFDDISIPFSASDIVVSRSGAMALNEMAHLEKAMILIPLPSSAANHQYHNAKYFLKNKAAIMINENKIKDELDKVIIDLINDSDKINIMGKNANKLISNNGLDNIISEIINLVQDYKKKDAK